MDQDTLLRELWAQLSALRTEVSELRVEISEMEATVADLATRVDHPDRVRLPWPVTLMLLPAALTLALLRQLDELTRALSTECDEQRRDVSPVRGESP
ncbi:hypothetical protein [Nocardia sp. NPDC019395]|uniref:hypothetical protein n=1 Tax=Nocardia sp. NPDC019395 TaxID=3154686 RepID=UPI0033DFEC22